MNVLTGLVALSAVFLSPSLSDAAVVNWRFEITTDDGDEIVEPGENAQIRVLADLSPSSGEYDESLGATITGFGDAFFDLQADGGWAGGSVTEWNVNPGLLFLYGDTSYLDRADQSIRDITCAQYPGLEFYDERDPIFLLDIAWSPEGDYTPRTASLAAHARPVAQRGEEVSSIYARPPGWTFDDFYIVPLVDSSIAFQIVPAPGSSAMLAIGVGCMRRRRRGLSADASKLLPEGRA